MNFKFSEDELRVLRECSDEGLLRRSLPFAVTLAMTALYAVKGGLLRPNVRYGAVPKCLAAAAFGFCFGQVTYRPECARRLMALPDSAIGRRLRRERGCPLDTDQEDSRAAEEPQEARGTSLVTEESPLAGPSLIEAYRPSMFLSDDAYDSHRPFADPSNSLNNVAPKSTESYDDIRKRNREQYEKHVRSEVRKKPLVEIGENDRNVMKNQYGDVLN